MQVNPLTLDDWRDAVSSAKKNTMRGVDGWSTTEMRALPCGWVRPLLSLFDRISRLATWPRQLSVWLLVLLRQSAQQVADWSVLRPISVASLTYRLWSRMHTKRMMIHASSLALPFTTPRLSARAIWGWLAESMSSRSIQVSRWPG